MSLQHPHPHTGPGDTWLMAIRDEPGRGWKAQSDLISSPRLYAVLPIKSSGLMPPLFSSPPTRRSLLKPQLSGNGRGEGVTHTGAADEDHAEGLYDAGDAHHPCEPQEEDHPKDVLQARQVHTHEGAHAGGLPGRLASVSAALPIPTSTPGPLLFPILSSPPTPHLYPSSPIPSPPSASISYPSVYIIHPFT